MTLKYNRFYRNNMVKGRKRLRRTFLVKPVIILLSAVIIFIPLQARWVNSKINHHLLSPIANTSTRTLNSLQVVLPSQYVCTFFYPWYGRYRHWNEGGHNPPATWASNYLPDLLSDVFDPENELYSSDNEKIILWQLEAMKRAAIGVAVSSWWGKGSYEDQVFRKIITEIMDRPSNPYRNLKWAICYEKEGYLDPSIEEICDDLNYISINYGLLPYYFKLDGRIVVFVYADANDGVKYAQKWKNVRDNLGNMYIVLKVFPGYHSYANLADSWYQYAPALRYESQGNYSAFVSPGFWRYHENVRLTRNPDEFENAVYTLMNSSCQFLMIQTWNEWHEGTQIEPGQEIIHNDENPPFKPRNESYGYTYIDIVAKYARPLMPLPMEINFISPKTNDTLTESLITVRIKIKDVYSTNVEAKISIDGGSFLSMEFIEKDAEDHLHFKFTANFSDGIHHLIVYAKDEYDYFSDDAELNFTVDTTPPTGSIKINEGAAYTNVSIVTLTLSAIDETTSVAEMRLSNDNVTYTEWQPYFSPISWNLTEGDGAKTVYIQFKDKAGLISQTYADNIILDTTPPIIGIPLTPRDEIQPYQDVKVSVNITDSLSGIFYVKLSYCLNNSSSWVDLPMILNATTNFYEVIIPGQPANTLIIYKVIAYDNAGNYKIEDNKGQNYTFNVIPEFSSAIFLLLMIIMTLILLLVVKYSKTRISSVTGSLRDS